MEKFNLAVIGAGSGGLVCAAGASGLGAKVLLVERHRMGGDCLNTGCVPSKALLRSAKIAHLSRCAGEFGVQVGAVQVDFRAVMERVARVRATIAPHDSVERFRGMGVRVEFGSGMLASAREVEVNGKRFRAKRIVIATGSRPRRLSLPGVEAQDCLTNETVWDLRELPARLVVLGGGPIGVELAQCFRRLGSEVTLVSKTDRLLPRDDAEASGWVQRVFEREGISILLGASATAAKGRVLQVKTRLGAIREIPFDKLLVAIGREANVEGLGLEKLGIACNENGIEVDSHLETHRRGIYACGDVAGPFLFTHMADYQARLILRNALFPGASALDYRAVPWCTFIDPEIAQVGLNEPMAKSLGIPYQVTRYDLAQLDRAICEGADEGFVKVLTEPKSDRLLGATVVGEHAGDWIHELALALRAGVGLSGIAAMVHAYPTWAEGPKRVADAWRRRRLTPTASRLLGHYFRWRLL